MDWYVIQAFSNCEKKVKAAIEERIEISGLGEMFGEIMIPTEQVTELKKGQKKQLERKLSLSAHKTLPRVDVRPAARSSSIGEMLIVEEEEEEEEEEGEGEEEVEAQVIEAAPEEQAEAAEGDLKVTAVEEVILGDEFDEPFGFDGTNIRIQHAFN